MTFKPFAHQQISLKFMRNKKSVMDASDPGVGKTMVEIMDFVAQHKKDGKAMLVLCNKSLMVATWANDIKKFAPHLKVSVCWAKNRAQALDAPADVYVVNHDGVKDLLRYKKAFFSKFGRIVVDECTAFKHHTSARSKALAKIATYFEWKRLMSGTLGSNGICDVWHPYFVLDGGKRLGKSYFGFRSACCDPVQTGPSAQMVQWTDKECIEKVVGALVNDITIRHKFEDCVDIPANHRYSVDFELTPKHLEAYEEMRDTSIAELKAGKVTAVNAASVATKLLQIASGAVYNDDGHYSPVATERYGLVLDLVEERAHSIVFYHWKHQLEELVAEAQRRKLTHVVWNPDKPEIEQQFQAGFFQVLFAHPQSAGHGLTFTRATATIWASPTYNLEHFEQGLKRIDRIGQTQKTETIVVVAKDTVDEKVWTALQNKSVKMLSLLEELQ